MEEEERQPQKTALWPPRGTWHNTPIHVQEGKGGKNGPTTPDQPCGVPKQVISRPQTLSPYPAIFRWD